MRPRIGPNQMPLLRPRSACSVLFSDCRWRMMAWRLSLMFDEFRPPLLDAVLIALMASFAAS
ncbi:MAG: hypothetical protein MO853_05155 [Candidatus Protistobacter heckmanni]|nr:hypothetical protein [Candidatus Protistobacter heckmanni]